MPSPPPGPAAADGVAAEDTTCPADSLPPVLLAAIFALLPVDARLHAACVCTTWRAAASERSLWTALDLSAATGRLSARGATPALLRAAAARAAGALAFLDVTGCTRLSHAALLRVAAANAATLTELRVADGANSAWDEIGPGVEEVAALLRAAPALHALHADARVALPAACAMLRREGEFAPLRLRALHVVDEGGNGAETLCDALRGASLERAAQASLEELHVEDVPLRAPGALDGVVNAARRLRLRTLTFERCSLLSAALYALAHLLRPYDSNVDSGDASRPCCDGLVELRIFNGHAPLLSPRVAYNDAVSAEDDDASDAFGAALERRATLASLHLGDCALWRDEEAWEALLRCLTGHGSLATLRLTGAQRHAEDEDDAASNLDYGQEALGWRLRASARVSAGAALGALVAANAPALRELCVAECRLGDEGLRPLLAALRRNAHLRALDGAHNGTSEALARDALLPAVRANGSLRELALLNAASPFARVACVIVRERAVDAEAAAAIFGVRLRA
jgi:hypothetical protein